MLFRKRTEVRRPGVGPPSQLLAFIGGEFAPRIAAVWPQPHAQFLAATAARRHVVCLALAHAAPNAAIDGEALLRRPLRRAIESALAAAPPPGLARSLEKLGEPAWAEVDYRRLLRLLGDPRGGKVLRHRERIEVNEVRALSLLPCALLETGLGRWVADETAAGLVAEAFAAIARRDGEASAAALAPRWGAADSLKALVDLARHDLEPEITVAPPFEFGERLRPLASKAALIDAAARYRNCLGNQLRWACSGESGFYEWAGPPGVVVEITRDRLHGWRLDQARLAGNEAVPEPTRSAIVEVLTAAGVHIGRPLWSLDDALEDLVRTPRPPVRSHDEAIGLLFGDD